MAGRISVKKMLDMAKNAALSDRESLMDCYDVSAVEDRNDIQEDIDALNAWEYKPQKSWTDEDKSIVFKILIWAEQWEEGYMHSKPGKVYEKQAAEAINRYKSFRLKYLGRSAWEALQPHLVPVDLETLSKVQNVADGDVERNAGAATEPRDG